MSASNPPDPALADDVAAYLAHPTGGEKLETTFPLSLSQAGILQRLAAARGVAPAALAEYLIFKGIRADHARLLVDEPLDPVPASFADERVAAAKRDLEAQVAAVKAHEERGDKASRIAAQMEAVLQDAQGGSPEAEALQREAAKGDAMLEMALDKERRRGGS